MRCIHWHPTIMADKSAPPTTYGKREGRSTMEQIPLISFFDFGFSLLFKT